jgi:hypothetical protein
MTENITRQPQVIPAGGQCASTAHAEAGIASGNMCRAPGRDAALSPRPDFYPSAEETDAWPALYSTEEGPIADKPIRAHYFQGGLDWYVR